MRVSWKMELEKIEMNITIVGGGNVGTQFAVHCSEKKHKVIIFSSKPKRFKKVLTIVDENGNVIHEGNIEEATDNAKRAFSNADMIFITMPAYCMKKLSDEIYPYVRAGVKIALIPGTGGGECAFRKCIEKGAVVLGLQRVPSVARLVEYGRKVRAVGYRKELYVAAIPMKATNECCEIVQELFDMPCVSLPNYLNITLTPSNPILHTTRLRILFKDYQIGMVYDSVPLFYEDWSDESSELLLRCDEEVQNLCRKIEQFDLSYVKSLKEHYESETIKDMTSKISGIKGFKGLTTPTKKFGGGYIPDLNSRYFIADFAYGLTILIQIAEMFDVDVSNMMEILRWYEKISDNEGSYFDFRNYKINSQENFVDFYMQ